MAQTSDLFQAAYDGNLSVFQELTEDGHIDYYRDKSGNTLLSIAARGGHADLVELLLAKDARTSIRNSKRKTPLDHAAENGYKEIVELLLNDKNFLNPESLREAVSETVLSAAAGGHVSLLKHLIQDYNYDLQHEQAQMIFNRGAATGHKEIVKLLLGRYDVKINGRDDSGNTALYLAVQACHEDVVAILLEREDIDINKSSRRGSAFGAALNSGREDLAEMLYARDRAGGEKGRKALRHATENGDTKTVKWLLSKDEVDVNAKIYYNSRPTLLHIASRKGYTETAKLLLARNDIIVNAKDSAEKTPLHEAAYEGHTEVVKLLLTRNDIIVNAENTDKETPLHFAAYEGHTEIVKLLLTRNDIMVNAKGYYEKTPLHKAAYEGHTEIVKLLLTRDDIAINAENNSKETPLHIAVNNGLAEIVRLLLDSDGGKDCNITSLLYDAAKKGRTKITQLLLTRIKSGINSEIDGSRTLLHIAAENDHTDMVKWLLETDGINVNAKTRHDKTPMFLALQNKHESVIKLLLARDDLDRKAAEFSGGYLINWAAKTKKYDLMDIELARECNEYPSRTPLTRYSENGYYEALKCLLERDGIDVNSMDSDGRTPLSRAAEKGHSRVVEMLLQCKADCNFKDSDGRTPLAWAAENGHKEVAKQLVPHDTATLLLLTREGNKRAIDFILCYQSPSLEEKNDRGRTALHLAALLGYQDITRALMLQGVDVNSKDDYEMTPLQLSMQRKHGDVIRGLLAFKACPEGITAKEWRDAFGKQNENVIQLSRGLGGEHYVNFPTTILAGDAQLEMSAKIKSHL
ncbi:hypothetical protein ACHAPX_006576 [Trichoderma viride]